MAEKIGIFGGSFNPIHAGHLNSLRYVMKKNKLSKVFLVPNNKNPLREASEDMPSGDHRVNMIKLALKDEKNVSVDEQEVNRGGTSYTIETIRFYESKYGSENIFFIMGADSFESFDQWKNYEDILKASNLIVTTRPHSELPFEVEDFPKGLQPLVKNFEPNGVAKLKSGRQIIYTQLEDLDVSATQIRKRFKLRRSVDSFLNFEVEQYIKEHDLYAPLDKKIPDFEEFTKLCAQVLFDKKAIAVRGFDLRKMNAPSEYSLVCSGTSTKQTVSLANSLVRYVKEEYNVLPISLEGLDEGRWVLVDYGALIVHVFYDYVRNEYRLEELWREGIDLQLKDTAAPPKK
ncbi:MAG: nicotinate (nicotinamide) nucleotide adenylyltransferase [Bdellovibrionota bacterium]